MKALKIRTPKRYYLEDYMQDFRDEMENLLKSTFEFQKDDIAYRPPIELCETNGNYELKAQLPGIKKEDIEVEVYEEGVNIKAESAEKKEEEKENLYRSEFRYGKFVRKIPLPSEVMSQQAKAEFKDGVLTITLPKSQKGEKEMKRLKVE